MQTSAMLRLMWRSLSVYLDASWQEKGTNRSKSETFRLILSPSDSALVPLSYFVALPQKIEGERHGD